MLSREENELLTRTGPGTAMGEVMRRYWIPALLAREIAEPDGPPVRVRLLGEDLVAFRDSDGRIGLLDEYCPHRRASLWFGRNEECGLRCVYHGWKFAVDGSCVDQMNEPEENQFKHKVRLTAYPTYELSGLVWAYMGPPEKIPPLPKFAWTQAPETHRHVSKVIQDCNWLQGLEGGLDTSHAPILHRLLKDNAGRGGIKPSNPYVRACAPRLVVDITDYGYQYTGIRRLGLPKCTRARTITSCRFTKSAPPRTRSATGAMRGTPGFRSMMRRRWSTIGYIRANRRRSATKTGSSARSATAPRPRACRPDDIPFKGQPQQRLHPRARC